MGCDHSEGLATEENNIKTDLKEKGNWDVDGTHLAQDRPQYRTLEYSNESQVSISGPSDYQLLKNDSVT
jgi:hypothetical protein